MDSVLEVCVDNIQSAKNAEDGGADRIELCQALEVGGLTPSKGLMRKIKEMLSIPVFVMIRPRSGNFVYNEYEVSQMIEDIQVALDIGVDGFVFGALRNNKVDKSVCAELMSACNGYPVTFHRAIDMIQSPCEGVMDLVDIGFSRVLTSGQSPTAFEGMKTIKYLVEKVDSKIIIMPGCGINEKNLIEIKNYTGASEFHSSAQLKRNVSYETEVVKGASFHSITSVEVVKNMKKILINEIQKV